jgi:hypothetical protein
VPDPTAVKIDRQAAAAASTVTGLRPLSRKTLVRRWTSASAIETPGTPMPARKAMSVRRRAAIGIAQPPLLNATMPSRSGSKPGSPASRSSATSAAAAWSKVVGGGVPVDLPKPCLS